ncbi:MAG: RcpC/CpaB family pilus assembly protein [Acidimicrobiales bacterium]
MSNSKSTRIIAIGVAVFIVGGALLFLVLRNGGSSKAKTPSAVVSTTPTTVAGAISFPSGATAAPVIAFKIPEGQNAVAIPMDYFAGGGGYVRSGDLVNIYALFNKDCASKEFPAAVKLLKSNVRVLEVLGSPPAASGAASSYLLALSPQDAERLIFNAKFAGLYFTLTTNNEPAASTTGITCSNAL